jgi:CBS domain-containing protein
MTPEVVTVAPHAALTEVAKEMVRRRIGALPVCDERGLVGIITETDLLRAMVAATGGEK